MSAQPPFSHQVVTFDADEQKLALAFQLIDALTEKMLRIDAMLSIDQTIISALCEAHPGIAEHWPELSSRMLAELTTQSLRFNDQAGQAIREAATARHRFWTQVLEKAADGDG